MVGWAWKDHRTGLGTGAGDRRQCRGKERCSQERCSQKSAGLIPQKAESGRSEGGTWRGRQRERGRHGVFLPWAARECRSVRLPCYSTAKTMPSPRISTGRRKNRGFIFWISGGGGVRGGTPPARSSLPPRSGEGESKELRRCGNDHCRSAFLALNSSPSPLRGGNEPKRAGGVPNERGQAARRRGRRSVSWFGSLSRFSGLPVISARKATTTAGSKCVPLRARICSSARASGQAMR